MRSTIFITSILLLNYIINLKPNTKSSLDAHVNYVKSLFIERNGINKIQDVYNHIGKSYSAYLTEDVLQKVRSLSDVAFIEKNVKVKLDSVQTNAPWGISRISQRNFTNTFTYTYDGNGEGVTVYVIDSGILITHPEFEGRAKFGARFTTDTDDDGDGLGHGTHCAGTVGSKTYGVAKKVNLVAVKVFDNDGNGNFANIISAINWVVGDKRGAKGNVISMSLGGPVSESVNSAIETAYQKGFVIVVSAGNDSRDACTKSPASSPSAITVAASTANDDVWSLSNTGKCVDIFAPGSLIVSTYNDGKTDTLSGTSMSTPHVAGLAAYYLSKEVLTNSQITQKILKTATKDAIKKNKPDTVNLLAYNNIV
ncbi:putative subtilisin-like protease precursor [Neoconidiobolus thromboides FSU 785]|nr:putative subtilisin-like protease precursor [Neoconidiobolus thromboides FSU 785]